jgi:N-acetylmuramoyl-L-alanine amidase
MAYNRIVLSSGHGLYVRGACGILDEVDEARLVVEQLADDLRHRGVDVVVFHDDDSRSQNENLNRIVDFHNAQPPHDLDVSCHFNAYEQVSKPMGTEVLYVTQKELAAQLSAAIASVGFINRGGKRRDDLFFLNNTIAPAVLLEICFVDSEADADLYHKQFSHICEEIACVLAGIEGEFAPEPEPPESDYLFEATGKCSHFGGEDDHGVSADEGLAFHYAITEANQHLFVPIQPIGTTGLARRLNAKAVPYIACRWDYDVTPKKMLAESGEMALVTNVATGRSTAAFPADWGPHDEKTGGRVADLSPALMRDLDLETDDIVEVVYPWMGD